jgi:uncharacterized protein (DUF433 family)
MASTAPFDLGTLIEATPGVYGGRPCLAGTRMPILQIAVLTSDGVPPSEIARRWELDLAKVHAGIAYYLANKEAIDRELDEETRLHHEAAAADLKAHKASKSA